MDVQTDAAPTLRYQKRVDTDTFKTAMAPVFSRNTTGSVRAMLASNRMLRAELLRDMFWDACGVDMQVAWSARLADGDMFWIYNQFMTPLSTTEYKIPQTPEGYMQRMRTAYPWMQHHTNGFCIIPEPPTDKNKGMQVSMSDYVQCMLLTKQLPWPRRLWIGLKQASALYGRRLLWASSAASVAYYLWLRA